MIDFQSPTWAMLRGRMVAAQGKALTQLTLERDPIIAAELRGRIAALQDIIALDTPVEPSADEKAPPKRPSADSSGY